MQVDHIGSAEAERLVELAARCAADMGVPQNIAVVDAAGHLVAFRRMDGAKFISIEIAIAKAFTAAGTRKATREIGPATQPGEPGFGIQNLLGGRFTTLPGGLPITVNGAVIGAIGVSSGTTSEDQAVAEAALDAFAEGRTPAE